MARNRYYHDPARKHIEVFQDFSGGLNTQTANDNLADNEMTTLKNYDLSARGSLVKTKGFTQHLPAYVSGKAQGYFRFFKQDGTFDEILVINGQFFVNGIEMQVGTGATFQTDRPMEAVQYYQKLYIATGNGLVEYDGTTLDFVTPHNPQPLEALYIGVNGLMTNPDDYIETTSGEVAVTKVKGVKFDKRYGIQNEFITIDMFAEKVNSTDTLEWKVERKLPSHKDDYWFLSQDWATSSSHTFSTDWTGTVKFKISVRVQGDTAPADEYIVPKYTIKDTKDPNDDSIDSASIDNCNRILVHWDRLMLYGDTGQPDVLYISHLRNPAYFPTTNSLRFNNVRQEGLTKLVQFRDNIVAFTDTTIQALYGKAPIGNDPYQRVMLNSGTGCIAPESAKVTDNYITFLSYEGVYRLKSLGYTENKANVEPIDERISDDIPQDRQAVGYVYDQQYCIVFPSLNRQYRYYFERGVWASDESTKFDYELAYFFDGTVYLQGSDGRLVKTDDVLTIEGQIEDATIETKEFDFNEPYAIKKVKELHVMVDSQVNTQIDIEVSVDGVVDNKNIHTIDVTPSQDTYIRSITGKGYLTKIRLVHSLNDDLQINGLGVVFKLKKP